MRYSFKRIIDWTRLIGGRRLSGGLIDQCKEGRHYLADRSIAQHAETVSRNDATTLVGVTDAMEPRGREIAQRFGCKWFPKADDLIGSGEIDAVVVATPHWQHADLAKAALRSGLHVMCPGN